MFRSFSHRALVFVVVIVASAPLVVGACGAVGDEPPPNGGGDATNDRAAANPFDTGSVVSGSVDGAAGTDGARQGDAVADTATLVPDAAADTAPLAPDAAADTGDASPGCSVGPRFVVLAPHTAFDFFAGGCARTQDGSGRVLDTMTGLTWMRLNYSAYPNFVSYSQTASYCAMRGMRLPTKDEALDLGAANDRCAIPCSFYTWTSTSDEPNKAWYVFSGGLSSSYSYNTNGGGSFGNVLCVQ